MLGADDDFDAGFAPAAIQPTRSSRELTIGLWPPSCRVDMVLSLPLHSGQLNGRYGPGS